MADLIRSWVKTVLDEWIERGETWKEQDRRAKVVRQWWPGFRDA